MIMWCMIHLISPSLSFFWVCTSLGDSILFFLGFDSWDSGCGSCVREGEFVLEDFEKGKHFYLYPSGYVASFQIATYNEAVSYW